MNHSQFSSKVQIFTFATPHREVGRLGLQGASGDSMGHEGKKSQKKSVETGMKGMKGIQTKGQLPFLRFPGQPSISVIG
jgi:hypothetical protein